jgi:hypothetical protein
MRQQSLVRIDRRRARLDPNGLGETPPFTHADAKAETGRKRGKQGQGREVRKEAAQEEPQGKTGSQEAEKSEVTLLQRS